MEDSVNDLLATAEAMLKGELQLIKGCRLICRYRFCVDNPTNPVFIPIIGIESETDDLVLGKPRENCAPEHLRQMDAEMDRYLSVVKDTILESCREIIRVYSKTKTDEIEP